MSIRFGVISDIHGNWEGLTAVLEELHRREITEVFCLGDVVGYGADPEQCWNIVKNECAYVLEGNHEAILLEHIGIEKCSALGKQSADWTQRRVSEQVKKELRQLPFYVERHGALFVHTTSKNNGAWPYLNRVEDVLAAFSNEKNSLIFYGHTHRPRITVWNSNDKVERDELVQQTSAFSVDLTQRRCYINPGSVGQQRDTHTDASFAVCTLEGNLLHVEIVRIEYDSFTAYQKLLQGGGEELATYLIREQERRDRYEMLTHRR